MNGLDHAHGFELVDLGLDGVSDNFDSSWTSFISDILLFGGL